PRPFDPTQFAAKVQHILRLKDAQDRADLLARHLLAVNRQLEHSLRARSHDVRQAQDALLFVMAKLAESCGGESAGHQRRLERYDGTGYPDRLAGQEIPAAARLVAVADAYDSLRRKQPHKPVLSHAEAARRLVYESDGAFDPLVLKAFELCQERFERIFLEVI